MLGFFPEDGTRKMDRIKGANDGREGTGGASLDGRSELDEIQAIEDGFEQDQRLAILLIVEVCLHPLVLEHPLTFYEEKIT